MGWLYGWENRRDLIDHLTGPTADAYEMRPDGTPRIHTVKRACVGNHLWAVLEDPAGGRFIVLFLLRRSGGQWGYKDIEETCGPVEVDCPPGFLALAPPPEGDSAGATWAREWRERVRAYHARRGMRLRPGDTVRLTNGWTMQIAKLRPLEGRRIDGPPWRPYYRIPRKMLSERVDG